MFKTPLFLCADCGGTKVKVCIADSNGPKSIGLGGPCNFRAVGAQAAIEAIITATQDALSHCPEYQEYVQQGTFPEFATIWVAMAGVQQPSDAQDFHPYLCHAFNLPQGSTRARITNDCDLLASPLLTHPNSDSCISVVAGTGSASLAFRKRRLSQSSSTTDTSSSSASSSNFRNNNSVDSELISSSSSSLKSNNLSLERIGICRGWGYLIGDEGSAFHIGMLSVRSLLEFDDDRVTHVNTPIATTTTTTTTTDATAATSTTSRKQHKSNNSPSMPSPAPSPLPSESNISDSEDTSNNNNDIIPFHRDLLEAFGVSEPSETIPKAYSCHSDVSYEAAESSRKLWFASAAPVVLTHAFPEHYKNTNEVINNKPEDLIPGSASHKEAQKIVYDAIDALVYMVVKLIGDQTVVDPNRTSLLLGGGLWQSIPFKEAVLDRLLSVHGIKFALVQVVPDAATAGATTLAATHC